MNRNTMQKTEMNVRLQQEKLTQAAELLRALAHPLRLKIIGFIDKNDSIHVNKIYNSLKLEQSITSQHLRILRLAEVVNTRREGKFIFYSLNYDKLGNTIDAIRAYLDDTGK